LDLTSEGEPFDPMPKILALADRVEKLTAICACGEEATRSYHRGGKTAAVEVGGADEYEARCYACWERGMFEKLRAT
jgi:thymidine kinase